MAAGLGKRLRPLTDDRPKPLIEVGGRPILEWTFSALPHSVEEVIVVVGYLKDLIIARFGDGFAGKRVRYAEQTELKGTGHAVAILEPLLDDRFLVMNGDDLYLPGDIEALCGHEQSVLAVRMTEAGRFGALATDAKGDLTAIVEGGAGSAVNAGAYVVGRQFFSYGLVPIKGGEEFGLPQTIALMAQDHPVRVVEARAWLPIGFPEDVPKADAWLREHRPDGVRALNAVRHEA